MQTVKEKQNSAFESLKEEFGYKNKMQAPRLVKVIVSTGVGKQRADSRKMELIAKRLSDITGQKASERPAKKSIATFKVREGQLSGYQVTIRGNRMYTFLDKLVNVALPRTRDFRGLSPKVDEMGNYTMGIKENTIFPETADQDIKDVFGIAITVVTTSSEPAQTQAFLRHLGFPLKAE
jgi:large subunit ribosomal protein L5